MSPKALVATKPKEHPDPEQFVARLLAERDGAPGAILSVLHDVQDVYGYLPEEALRTVSNRSGRRLVDIYAIATFYRSFSLKPKGKHVVAVCLGTACHVRGAPAVAEEFERRLGIKAGESTPDGEFTLETVNCLGACALGPIVKVNGRYFSNVNAAKVRAILREIGTELRDKPTLCRATAPVATEAIRAEG